VVRVLESRFQARGIKQHASVQIGTVRNSEITYDLLRACPRRLLLEGDVEA